MLGSTPAPPSRRVTRIAEPDDSACRLLERNLLRCPRQRIDEADLALLGGDREHGEAAVLQLEDRRIGDGAKPLGGHAADDPRLELQEVGRSDQILRLREPPRQRQLMSQLRRIRRNAVIARDQRQRRKATVERLRHGADVGPVLVRSVHPVFTHGLEFPRP